MNPTHACGHIAHGHIFASHHKRYIHFLNFFMLARWRFILMECLFGNSNNDLS